MEKKYSLLQRITSATPSFFKKLQTIALAVAGLGSALAATHSIPQTITTVLISAGTAIAAVAQFAVKLEQPDEAPVVGNKETP